MTREREELAYGTAAAARGTVDRVAMYVGRLRETGTSPCSRPAGDWRSRRQAWREIRQESTAERRRISPSRGRRRAAFGGMAGPGCVCGGSDRPGRGADRGGRESAPVRQPVAFPRSAGRCSFLSAIVQAMISFTAVVFSITVVVPQLSSSQYSPRVLRRFLRDRLIRFSLGVFVATFAYAMVVLSRVGEFPRKHVVLRLFYVCRVARMGTCPRDPEVRSSCACCLSILAR
jgi:Predicted membrane protein (DUF2254)